jgi:diguanylate cyclase (GGDEF)-like protein/PAS domain S-box-containing protein
MVITGIAESAATEVTMHGNATLSVSDPRVDVEFLALVLDRSDDFVTIVSMDGRLVYANQTVRTFFGVQLDRDIATLTSAGGFTREARRALRDVVWPALHRDGAWTGELTLVNADGAIVTVLQSSQLHRDDAGIPLFISGIGRDVTELKAVEQRLIDLARVDPLTGLANRAAVLERLTRHGSDELGGALLFIDIDGFKAVNDRHGHVKGDALLAAAATRLRSAVRPEDFVGRIGGDEFVVICDHLATDDACHVADRIVGAFGMVFGIDDVLVNISASVGIAALHGQAAEALAKADGAMYDAKRAGGGHVRAAATRGS